MISPRIQRYVAAHQQRGDDPWLLVAKLYMRAERAEERSRELSEANLRCAWIIYNGESWQVCGALMDPMPELKGEWWRGAVTSRDGVHVPLCSLHLEAGDRRFKLLKFTGLKRDNQRRDYAAAVYFLRRADGLIKIGFANNVKARMVALRKQHGDLMLLGMEGGGRAREQELHGLFALDRVEGEWFRPSPGLLAHVRSLRVPDVNP